jgi:hypothetical protein
MITEISRPDRTSISLCISLHLATLLNTLHSTPPALSITSQSLLQTTIPLRRAIVMLAAARLAAASFRALGVLKRTRISRATDLPQGAVPHKTAVFMKRRLNTLLAGTWSVSTPSYRG